MNDYDAAREYAGDVGRQAGFGVFCLLSVAMISYERGIPAGYVWLSCALVGLVAYTLVGVGVRIWVVARVTALPREWEQAEVEAEEVAQTGVLWEDGGVNWLLLLRHLQQPDATLSRSALVGAGIVNQRAYSPVDGSLSFPERMVALGAAVRINNGNAPSSYLWTAEARRIVREGIVALGASRNALSPTLSGA